MATDRQIWKMVKPHDCSNTKSLYLHFCTFVKINFMPDLRRFFQVYNVFEGNLVTFRKDLHEREITAMTFFNPLKYLVTGALDGTSKYHIAKHHYNAILYSSIFGYNTIVLKRM